MINVSTLMNQKSFRRFAVLQGLDVATTLVGFLVGCNEANPAISHFFPALGPLVGLLVGKVLTVLVILMFLNRPSVGTENGWRFVNILFSLLILWNLVMIGLRVFSVV